MEGFLSLPRAAKGGLAVLLAVALLGWGIVAYSAKRQHEDARSLENAIATLKSREDHDAVAASELESLKERFETTEADLAASRDEKSDLEAKLAKVEAERSEEREAASAAGGALALFEGKAGEDEARDGDAAGRDAEKAPASKVEALRSRLTGAMTDLSAKTAMLEQRDRQLAQLKAEYEMSLEGVRTILGPAADDGDSGGDMLVKLDEKLEQVGLTLNANREAIADQETRLKSLSDQQATIEEAISEKEVTLLEHEQKRAELNDIIIRDEAALEANRDEIEETETALAGVRTAHEEREAESSALAAEIDALEASLAEKQDELQQLGEKLVDVQEQLVVKETALEETQSVLRTRNVDLQGAESSLAALKANQAIAEAENLERQTEIDRETSVREDLAALKGELDVAKAELASQTALLEEKRSEVALIDANSKRPGESSEAGSSAVQSLPRIPIAALSQDNVAVLPVDPTQHPFPVQTEGGVRLTLVHFDLGSAELTPGALRRAKEAAAWIKEQDIEKIRLVGATDTIGTKEDNMVLAKRRAQTLLDTFAAEGVDPARIELLSLGEAGGSEVIGDQTAEPLNRCVGVFIDGEG
ncbi:MAG: OmpA family protein [Geminicoccaceae bacterium]